MRLIASFLLSALLLALLLLPAPAIAASQLPCQRLNGQEICILTIQRSAKNYWEYRASVRVNGQETPIEVYNCRDRTQQRQDGTIVSIEPNSAGQLVCRLYRGPQRLKF